MHLILFLNDKFVLEKCVKIFNWELISLFQQMKVGPMKRIYILTKILATMAKALIIYFYGNCMQNDKYIYEISDKSDEVFDNSKNLRWLIA